MVDQTLRLNSERVSGRSNRGEPRQELTMDLSHHIELLNKRASQLNIKYTYKFLSRPDMVRP